MKKGREKGVCEKERSKERREEKERTVVPGRCAEGEECLYRRERGEPHPRPKETEGDSTRGGAMTRAQHCGQKQ